MPYDLMELSLHHLLPKGIPDYESLASLNPLISPDHLVSLLRSCKFSAGGLGKNLQFNVSPSEHHTVEEVMHDEIQECPFPSFPSSIWSITPSFPYLDLVNSKLRQTERKNIDKIIEARKYGFQGNVVSGNMDRFCFAYEKLVNILGHHYSVYCVLFDRTGQRMITAGDDGLAKVWCSKTGLLINTFRGHDDNISDLSISSDNRLLATASEDKTIKIWSLRDRSIVKTLFAPANVHTVHFIPLCISHSDNRKGYVLATFSDGLARCWGYNLDDLIFDLEPTVYNCKSINRDAVRCAAVSKGGTRFLTGGTDGVIRLFPSPNVVENNGVDPSFVHAFTDHRGYITNLAFSNAGDRFASGSLDGTARIYFWDKIWKRWRSHCLEMTLNANLEHVAPIPSAVSVTPPLESDDAAGDVNMEIDGHREPAEDENPINPDDENNTMDEEEQIIPVPRRLTRRQVQAQNRREEEARALAERREREMQEAERIAEQNLHAETTGADEEATSSKRNKPKKPKLTMVIWNLDDTYLITASADYVIRVWRSSDGSLSHALKFHENNIFVLTPHPVFPEIVLSAGYDGKVCLWDIYRGVLLKSFDEVGRLFLDGQFSEDGSFFAVTDETGRCAMYGLGKDKGGYSETPLEQFRLVDFDQIIFDANRFPLHEIEQVPPHEYFGPLLDGNKEPHARQPSEKYGWDIESSLGEDVWRKTRLSMLQNELRELDFLKVDLNAHSHVELVTEEALKRTRHKRVVYGSDVEDEEYVAAPVNAPSGTRANVPVTNNIPSVGAASSSRSANQADRNISSRLSNIFDDNNAASYLYLDDESDDEEFSPAHIKRSDIRGRRINTRSRYQLGNSSDLSSGFSSAERDSNESETATSGTSDDEDGESTETSIDDEDGYKQRHQRSRSSRNKHKSKSRERTMSMEEYQAYYPGESITCTKRLKNLYVPQMGDTVAYFRQGQEELLKKLKKNQYPHMYEHVPFHENQELGAVVPAQVVGLEYFPGNPAWCQLKLALITENEADAYMVDGHEFHDQALEQNRVVIEVRLMYNLLVSDYVILWSLYRWGLQQDWRVGQTVMAQYEEAKYEGVVAAHVPLDLAKFPTSPWYCLLIRWDHGDGGKQVDLDKHSPWELSLTASARAAATRAGPSHHQYNYKSWEDEEALPEIQRKTMISDLKGYMRSHGDLVAEFSYPVNLRMYYDYCTMVAYPMDLGLLCSRLQQGYYRRVEAFLWDLERLSVNAILYNQEDSPLVKDARRIVRDLTKKLVPSKVTFMADKTPSQDDRGERRSRRLNHQHQEANGFREDGNTSEAEFYGSSSSSSAIRNRKTLQSKSSQISSGKRFRIDPVLLEPVFDKPVSEYISYDGSRLRKQQRRRYNIDLDDSADEDQGLGENGKRTLSTSAPSSAILGSRRRVDNALSGAKPGETTPAYNEPRRNLRSSGGEKRGPVEARIGNYHGESLTPSRIRTRNASSGNDVINGIVVSSKDIKGKTPVDPFPGKSVTGGGKENKRNGSDPFSHTTRSKSSNINHDSTTKTITSNSKSALASEDNPMFFRSKRHQTLRASFPPAQHRRRISTRNRENPNNISDQFSSGLEEEDYEEEDYEDEDGKSFKIQTRRRRT